MITLLRSHKPNPGEKTRTLKVIDEGAVEKFSRIPIFGLRKLLLVQMFKVGLDRFPPAVDKIGDVRAGRFPPAASENNLWQSYVSSRLRVKPALEAGVSDHVWFIDEIVTLTDSI